MQEMSIAAIGGGSAPRHHSVEEKSNPITGPVRRHTGHKHSRGVMWGPGLI